MVIYQIGNTFKITLTVTDSASNAVAVDSVTLTITDANGTALITKTKSDLTKQSTGIYTYEWQADTAEYGDYYVVADGTMTGGKPFRVSDIITLEE